MSYKVMVHERWDTRTFLGIFSSVWVFLTMSETDTSSTATGPELLVALAKLTKKQRIAVYQLIDAYESFWDHIKFRKGWAEVFRF